jgi:hypothetical protein
MTSILDWVRGEAKSEIELEIERVLESRNFYEVLGLPALLAQLIHLFTIF